MNTTSHKIHKMPMIWGTLVLVMSLLHACPDADSSGESTPIPTPLKSGDITYNSIAQGTAGTATPKSSTIRDLSTLAFALKSISTYTGTGTQVLPIIDEEDGTITTTTTTSAGSYRVTITPDGSTILGNPITVDFYVTVKAANIEDLDTKLKQAVTDYGLTGDFNYIDTSEVTTMVLLFVSGYTPGSNRIEDSARTYIANFNGDISKWDVSAVINFASMFWNAAEFNQNIGGWDVSAGTNFSGMFWNAAEFNQDIGRWDVSAGTDFSNMFDGANKFNQDIGEWTVSVGQSFNTMFHKAISFDQDISRWTVSAGTDFSYMFDGATSFDQDIGGWTVSAGQYFTAMFRGATAFNQDLSEWKVDATDAKTDMFLNSGITNLPSWY